MRSRYSAHVLARVDYLVATHDAEGRAAVDRAAVERWARESEWLGLAIVARAAGGPGDDEGVVEFEATYRPRGGAVVVHRERSRFVCRDGRWFYRDGEAVKPPPARRAATVGRNEPCPCGSGMKHKRCCGRS